MATIDPDARVDPNDVRDIFDTDLDDGHLNAFINGAHRIVEDQLASSGLGQTTLDQIELYVSAHLATLWDQRAASESIGSEYTVSYQGQTGMHFEATFYGQTAMTMDKTGTLASAGLKRARFDVWGVDGKVTT